MSSQNDDAIGLTQQEAQILGALCNKYDISPFYYENNHEAMVRLVLAMAGKLYPNGITKKVGRPRKLENLQRSRSPGRPNRLRAWNKDLVRRVDEIKKNNNLVGRGSEKRALEIFLRSAYRDRKVSMIRVLSNRLPSYQKILSRERSVNRKNMN